MKFCLATPALRIHDAIGHDVLGMHDVLAGLGADVSFHCIHHEHGIAGRFLDSAQARDLADSGTCVLILHHGTDWPGCAELIRRWRGDVIIKYHNVTPPGFFRAYDRSIALNCEKGCRLTTELTGCPGVAGYLADSSFNASELTAAGVRPDSVRVVPPFLNQHLFERPSLAAHEPRDPQREPSVLAVGRLVPNKGHTHMLRALGAYVRRQHRLIRLHLVGTGEPRLAGYYSELSRIARDIGVGHLVSIHHRLGEDRLAELYHRSDVYLCTSEHEGFCVPLIEAQLLDLPVVALDRCAVGETLGPEQLLLPDADPDRIAMAIHLATVGEDLRRALTAQGRRNAGRFTHARTANSFTAALQELAPSLRTWTALTPPENNDPGVGVRDPIR